MGGKGFSQRNADSRAGARKRKKREKKAGGEKKSSRGPITQKASNSRQISKGGNEKKFG